MGEEKIVSEDFIEWRCFACRHLIMKFGISNDSFGILINVCTRSKCHAKNIILLFEGKSYLVRESLRKNQKMLLQFKQKHEELGLPKKEYSAILNLVE